jgi:hypothetical protein
MSILKKFKGFQFRHYLALVILLFACTAVLPAQQDDKNKERKNEPPRKTSQEKPKDQGKPSNSRPAQPARANPRTTSEPRPGVDQSRGQSAPVQPPSRENRAPERQNNPQPQPGRMNQGQQQNQPGAQPRQQEQRNADRNGVGQRGNQPGGQANTPSRPVPPRGNPGNAPDRQPQIVRYPNGQPHTVRMADGGMVRRSDSGRVVEVHTPGGAVIRHEPNGVRRLEVVRPGNRLVVTTGRNYGYVQRPIVFGNRPFVQRTYISRGVPYVRLYRPVVFGGFTLNIYTPVRYYRPAFYGWVYNPWPRPIVYAWGWGPAPWYGFYGGYFVPYSTYVSPVFWLTDYLIAASLESAYEDRIAASSVPPPAYAVGRTELTPEVKQLVADEVRRQIDMERAESQNANSAAYNTEIPPLFADNSRHTFVVSDALLVNSGLRECTLSEGDVIQTLGVPPMNSPVADARVLASKPAECRKGSVVSIQLPDLQEMQNYMRETVDRGLGDLQARGGQSGLPAPPPNSAGTIETQLAAQVQPDNNAAQELTQAEQEANAAEQNVVDQSASVAGQTGSGPVTISLGQRIDEVVATQGQPQKVVNLGNKQIYVYPDIKITFVDGRVTDVQ